MIVESWKHGLTDERVTRTTTTLLKWENGVPWFEHIDDKGIRWEDTNGGDGGDSERGHAGEGRDVFVTRQTLTLDGKAYPCRVILHERRSAPWSDKDPVSHWLTRSKRWETVDTTVSARVLKVLDLGVETHFRDGRIERQAGLSTRVVKTLREAIRVRGRSYDCWVQVTKTMTADGAFAGRTTVWGSDQAPTGWVRRIRETRDPRNGAMARQQEQVVDFRLK